MAEPRPRILFIAYFYPPMASVSSVRAINIAKHLTTAGWEVTVLTLDPRLVAHSDPSVSAESLDALGVRRTFAGQDWRFLSPGHARRAEHGVRWALGGVCRRIAGRLRVSEHVGWYRPALRAGRRLPPGQFDVVLATGCPWESLAAAHRLGSERGVPYVLDYRDLWTLGHPYDTRQWPAKIRRREAEILAGAAAVTVVAPLMAESFRRGFGIEDSRLHVIPNGYDADEYAAVPAAQFDHFAIVYAGGLFPPNRRLDPFFESLKLWDAQGKAAPWRFHYYGPYSELAAQSAQQCGVAERVQLHGRVPRHEVLSAVRGAQLTLIVSSVNEHGNNAEKNAITGKIFEPIGLGKPYLVIAPQGADVRDVAATAGGGAVFTGNQIGPMASYLAELAAGRAPPRRNPEAYAWQNLIRTLDSVLRSACGRPTRSSR